jgi:hypothetical protein
MTTALKITDPEILLAVGAVEGLILIETATNLLAKGLQNDRDLQEFADVLAGLDKRHKEVIKARTAFLAPLKSNIKLIENEFNSHAAELYATHKKINALFIDFQKRKQEEAERQARELAIQRQKEKAEAAAHRQEEARLVAEELAGEARIEAQAVADLFDEPVKQPEPQIMLEPESVKVEVLQPEPIPRIEIPKIKTASGSTVKITEKPIPIIIDEALVPEIYKIVDLRALVEAYEKGVKNIPGVTFKLQAKSSVR